MTPETGLLRCWRGGARVTFGMIAGKGQRERR